MSIDNTPQPAVNVPAPPLDVRPPGGTVWDDGRPTADELAVIDWLLTTTRASRKTLDLTRPVDPAVIEECLRIALQAPTAHNDQRWHWVVVTDEKKRKFLGDVYQFAWEQQTRGERKKVRRWKKADQTAENVHDSAAWLPEHLAEVPVHVIPCLMGPRPDDENTLREIQARIAAFEALATGTPPPSTLGHFAAYWGSIYPAVWSFQLALRSRGLGSCLTVVHLAAEAEVSRELGLPSGAVQTCLLPVAWNTTTMFKPAKRVPLENRISWDSWLGTR